MSLVRGRQLTQRLTPNANSIHRTTAVNAGCYLPRRPKRRVRTGSIRAERLGGANRGYPSGGAGCRGRLPAGLIGRSTARDCRTDRDL
jgi:hypothetical protein